MAENPKNALYVKRYTFPDGTFARTAIYPYAGTISCIYHPPSSVGGAGALMVEGEILPRYSKIFSGREREVSFL